MSEKISLDSSVSFLFFPPNIIEVEKMSLPLPIK